MTNIGHHTKNKCGLKITSFTSHVKGTCLSKGLPLKERMVKLTVRSIHTGITNQLGFYLAGLIEGDGSIILRKGEREKISPKIVFTFGKNEIPLYEKLQKTLDTGVIYSEKTGVCRYSITNADQVIHVINLVNGKFRTPKILALYKAIDNLNKWRNANIVKLPLDNSRLDSNGWLAGFIDTDGHFSIKLTGEYGSNDNVTRGRVQCVFSINQSELNRVTGESNVPFMTLLANFFQVNLNHKVANSPLFKKPANTIVFFAQSDRKHYIITTYLTKFPLMSSKYLNYLSFFKGLNYLGKRLTEQEIVEIRAIKSSMNNSRTYYNGDNLNDFYT